MAFILEKNYGYQIPKAMHPEVGRIVQTLSDEKGRELEAEEILEVFKDSYFNMKKHISLIDVTISSGKKVSTCTLTYDYNGKTIVSDGEGNGPIDACKNALMKDYENEFTISSYSEHSCGDKSSAKAIAYIQVQSKDILSCFGVGRDSDIATASIKAMFSALNRAFKEAI